MNDRSGMIEAHEIPLLTPEEELQHICHTHGYSPSRVEAHDRVMHNSRIWHYEWHRAYGASHERA